ncbi:DHA2 family efflux MFS transporter permease subunit [Nocardioides guangzhouensis]|uniref:DHA2 family efflux MFS transporter permease subunit n=1 Tax=Nocardioides guangzhouensis TaxID=2497878 RepID=A0A4Q4ZEV5_9ACTN|nr:DHA2 family efflux MFS transporter permease subunit [Nocardioides guangzhouensis]RYP86690.1 DHA2 family efflux MFS transporter permease subunit [Nocardioides guangzhouensis]
MVDTAPQQPPAPRSDVDAAGHEIRPWPALFALCLGFFMILVDTTIVTVATPAIMADLDADVNSVVWVTSAYLLAYAVPVLITGRLGDRFGPKNLYMVGLTVFTVASLWCGLTTTVEMLIVARVVQGLGASMMTPQTMAVITRIFPAERRGQAMALWGATAGVATLVGPILGGILVDTLGWEWIFFINVPVGVIGFVLAARLVPRLPTHPHRFDWLGVALSGLGMFALVFGIQEGHQYDWGTINGIITVWSLIVFGLVVLAGFVWWQKVNKREPLVPLSIFSDRNFSISNFAISTMSFTATAMGFPLMLYAQLVRGLSPTDAALLMVPMAAVSIVMAPVVGRFTDRVHPRLITGAGFAVTAAAVLWLALVMTPDSATWQLLVPMAVLGLGMAGVWAPLAATATRNLPLQLAGAGAGVYNATRQVGAVLGSAAIAVLMDSRLAAQGLSSGGAGKGEAAMSGGLPDVVHVPFSDAMSQSMLLPAAVLVLGFVSVLFFQLPRHLAERSA